MSLLGNVRSWFGLCRKCWGVAWNGEYCVNHIEPGTYSPSPLLGVVPPMVEERELAIAETREFVYDQDGERAFAPHCDQSVLHAPGECPFCDHYPDWQRMREQQRINYTGHVDPDKAPCPSAYWRSAEDVHRWPGNRPGGYDAPA